MAFDNYSKAQREAITHGAGPLMVLAGPGSGKTFVITHRIRHLTKESGIDPRNILVLTFSRAAAKEMQERFALLCPDCQGITFGTFHSVFFSLLKLAYGYRGEQVVKEGERIQLIQRILARQEDARIDAQSMQAGILEEIALIKQERIQIDFFYSKVCGADLFRQIYQEYEKGLAQLRKIDFEDMLLMTYELLQQREDIRKACQEKYRYILVDEFQDINRLQYMSVQLLAGESRNLTIVGDDDQSIYSFRGARPDIMLGFSEDFPNVKTVLLDKNFRSSAQIVEAAGRLIAHNKKRFPKRISAHRGRGKAVDILTFSGAGRQADTLIQDIKTYLSLGYTYSDIAVLYRTNIQPRILIERFLKLAIPFVLKDSVPNIYEHWIARDIFAYLRLSQGKGSREDLLRIANKPNRYIKREALQEAGADMESLRRYYAQLPYMLENINELEHCLRVIKELSLPRALAFIRRGVAYQRYLEDYCDDHGIEGDTFFDILEELEKSAGEYEHLQDWLLHIAEYKEKLEEVRKSRQEEEEGVQLMTFHASKGLEFPIVYIIDANQGICPYKKAKSADELEEERRMFYVAMTRAKDRLSICSSADGKRTRAEISEYIQELK